MRPDRGVRRVAEHLRDVLPEDLVGGTAEPLLVRPVDQSVRLVRRHVRDEARDRVDDQPQLGLPALAALR